MTEDLVEILEMDVEYYRELLTKVVERLEFISYDDDHVTDELVQTIKKALR